MSELDPLRYPIGRPQLPAAPLTPAERTRYLQQLAELPAQLTAAARHAGASACSCPTAPAAGPAGRLSTTLPTRT
ncbi:hypothetical protein [Hymenobacter sp. BRD67]|uniref:hypothetical protein n=1 Tax=Hymenobacter sp. BRD67 TaxID=2675877 RepID=UPI0020B8569C|nr:hypothetical protein [Hymenobacter sp. BRD67]